MQPDQIWQAALGELQLQMPRATFDLWVKPTSVVSYTDHIFVIACPNPYAQNWLETRLKSTIQRILSGISGYTVQVRFVIEPPHIEAGHPAEPIGAEAGHDRFDRSADDSAEQAINWIDLGIPLKFVNESLDTLDWNWPTLQIADLRDYVDRALEYWQAGLGLLLVGPVGNGKTHLVMGLAKHAAEQGLTIAVTSTTKFLDQLRESYGSARASYRTTSEEQIFDHLVDTDLLIIDDLHITDWKPWCRTKFGALIQRCWENEVPLLITSNQALNALTDQVDRIGLDEATLSRITGSTVRIALNGPDYRLERKRRVLTTLHHVTLSANARAA